MFENIITLTLNPAIDATVWVDGDDYTEPLSCVKREDYPGGKGINVSRVLTALSVKNTPFCVVGEKNAEKFEKLLAADGVSAKIFKNRGNVRENLSIVFPSGKLLKINFKGFSIEKENINALSSALFSHISNNTLVVFAGSLPCDFGKDDYKSLIAECKSRGARLAVDTNLFSGDEIIEIAPDIIKPNHIELAKMFGKNALGGAELLSCAETLAKFVPNVLVSCGENGLICVANGKAYRALAPKLAVKSTVGAGDSTLAGYICALQSGAEPPKAAAFAAACGSASVTLDGTQAVSAAQTDKMLKNITVSEIS